MARKTKYTLEVLKPIVEESYSWAQILKKLNLTSSGGNYRLIQHRVRLHNINIDHLLGQSWAKGETKKTNEAINRVATKLKRPNADVFIRNSPETHGPRLRKRLIKLGVEYKCSKCRLLPIWQDKELTLHVDHINGITNDNRLTNLRFLCPNCHQQTKTWGHGRHNKG